MYLFGHVNDSQDRVSGSAANSSREDWDTNTEAPLIPMTDPQFPSDLVWESWWSPVGETGSADPLIHRPDPQQAQMTSASSPPSSQTSFSCVRAHTCRAGAIGHDTHLGADFVETCRDGCGRSITSKHVALQHSRVLVSRHVSKVPETRTEDAWETEGACGRLQQIDQTIGLLVGQRVRMFICGRKRKRTNPDRRGDILPRWFYADDITTLNRY